MISATLAEALNQQIAMEAYASYYYLAMASWCDREGLTGCASFFHRQSAEEREHMLKLFHYLGEVDSFALTPGIAQPPTEFASVREVVEKAYAHEQKVTASINQLVSLCYNEGDHTTLNFLQWYVAEQREEEAMMRHILDRIKLIGEGPMSLYYIDKEVRAVGAAAASAEEGAAEA